ncbi:hypothetical protein OG607_27370 [Streptomyces sp. NBC_01537]|uniref:hypothetical protein n=1 Tax=Streptomyces sp. NBC_01537 TaxID=2903896 RepID=UPI00386C59CE
MTPSPVPQDATPAAPRTAVGAKDAARQGVLSAVRPDPQAGDGRTPVAWLHIVAPPSWSVTPSGRSWCRCGWDRTAIGRAAVQQLIEQHKQHRDACPLLHPQEGSKAA